VTGGFELGIHLANAHPRATAAGVVEIGVAAEALGFDSVWMTEHVIVGPGAAAAYGNVIHPLPALAFLAARTSRVALGTSVLVLGLHDPYVLAKQAASLQDLSGGRLRLGLGVGWERDEFRFLGAPFTGRARRADEAIALMRALWAGERAFAGESWSYEDGHFGPLPATPPALWIGGASRRAAERARALGATWHPIGLEPEAIAAARAEWPGLAIVPRVTTDDPGSLAEQAGRMREAGAAGAVLGLTVAPPEIPAALARLADRL
jgi:probable F420-dependent oxidoreductase